MCLLHQSTLPPSLSGIPQAGCSTVPLVCFPGSWTPRETMQDALDELMLPQPAMGSVCTFWCREPASC